MKTITLLSGLAALLLSVVAQNASALTPAQLTPQEQQRYAALKDDSSAQASFLITREYVRKAHDVVNGKLAPENLPDEPDQFDSRYLFPGDSATLKKAIQLSLSAYIDSRRIA